MPYELIFLAVTIFVVFVASMLVMLARSILLRLRMTLVLTIVSLAFWQASVYAVSHGMGDVNVMTTAVFLWPSIAVTSFYLFISYVGLQYGGIGKKRLLSTLANNLFAFAIAIQSVALISNEIFLSVRYVEPAGLEFSRGAFYYVYIFGLFVAFVAVLIRLFASISASRKNSQARRALKMVLATTSLAIAYGLTCNVLFPVVLNSQVLIGFGILTIDIFAIGFTLSVVRGQLFDIKLYAVRGVVYILALVTLASIYALAAITVSRWFFGASSSLEQMVLNVALALLLASVFQPIKRFFDRMTNRLFYRDNYNTSEFYARLSRLLTSTTDLRALLQRAADEMSTTLKGEYGLFFVYDKNHYVMTGTAKSRHRLPIQDARTIDAYVEKNGDKVIMTDLLTEHDQLRRLLISHKVCLVLPLRRGEDEIIGYFLMGDHRSGSYTRRDIRVLETIADELVIAIQNALSVQEVKELNATLQQRIDEATKELRASNAQLQRLDEAKDEFVSMASHQLRTPLTSVKGYIDMVLEGDAGKISDMQKHLLGEAFTSSERMVHLINDFLNVSRLQTGKFMIDRRQVDLASIVRQEVDGLQTTAGQRKLTLAYEMPASFPLLYLDEGKIRQVVMNFIDNAIYYSKENTTITINLKADDSTLELTVKDTGIGVPSDEQAQLFTKFYRASNARKQRPDGTGVGLYLAKKVIVAHGGSMVFSSVPDKGSVFGFTLPVKKMALAPAGDADDLDS